MKLKGNCIVGEQRNIDDFTSTWMSVKMHPGTYYRREAEIRKTLDSSKGMYAELDMGQFILLRFSEKEDVTRFHRDHHLYI